MIDLEAIRTRAEADANEFLDLYHFGDDDALRRLTSVICDAVMREVLIDREGRVQVAVRRKKTGRISGWTE